MAVADSFSLDKNSLAKRVVKGSDALKCCTQQNMRAIGKVSALISDLVSALNGADGDNSLALVPVVGAPWLLRALTLSPAEVAGLALPTAGSALVGATVLLTGAEFLSIAQTAGMYEGLALVSTAIGTLQRLKVDECEDCVKRSVLSQSHTRQRQTGVSILRRL